MVFDEEREAKRAKESLVHDPVFRVEHDTKKDTLKIRWMWLDRRYELELISIEGPGYNKLPRPCNGVWKPEIKVEEGGKCYTLTHKQSSLVFQKVTKILLGRIDKVRHEFKVFLPHSYLE